MRLKIYEFDMKLRYPFSISRHTYYSQQNIIVELQHQGFMGYGEATVNPYYNITIENLRNSFETIGKRLNDYVFDNPDQLYEDFSDFLKINSFALCALNNASWDLYAKICGTGISDFIELSKQNPPQTSYTIGIDDKDKMVKKMTDLPWPIYKIKLGTSNDLSLMKHLQKHTKSKLRVDANCAWTAEKTIAISQELKQLGVEFIEQPLSAGNPNQEYCFDKCSLPLIADESCCTEYDVELCHHKFHGINIKLLKCGGITPALRMIQKARELGLKIMIGCMSETSVGISASAQLLPYVDYADLDGPLLLAEDIAHGLFYDYGKLTVSNRNGIGIVFIGKN